MGDCGIRGLRIGGSGDWGIKDIGVGGLDE